MRFNKLCCTFLFHVVNFCNFAWIVSNHLDIDVCSHGVCYDEVNRCVNSEDSHLSVLYFPIPFHVINFSNFAQIISNHLDIDECSHGACYGDVNRCVNTEGSYTCTQNCPPGYKFDFSKDSCKDIDECINPLLNHCDQRCENVEGSYRCLCRTGYIANETMGTCRDFDECQHGRGPCQYGCINTEGSYKCFCPTGYRLVSNGHSCEDINECLEGDPKCLGIGMLCANMLGDYDCVKVSCPPGYEMTNNICSRDCGENDCGGISKRVIKFNSTFLRVGVPANQDLIWLAVSYSGTDGQQVLHSNTTFRLLTDISDQARQLFGLREIEDERGVIYTKIEIRQPHVDWYRLRVSAHSEGADGRTHFETIFSLYINVAPNPFL